MRTAGGMRARERYPRGQSSPHRAMQRLPAGRARDHPVMEIVPNKSFSLSLSPHTCGHTHKDVCMLDESRNHWAKTGLFLYKRPIFKISGNFDWFPFFLPVSPSLDISNKLVFIYI